MVVCFRYFVSLFSVSRLSLVYMRCRFVYSILSHYLLCSVCLRLSSMSEEDIEDRKRLVYQARLSEHCERYDDMVEAMKQVAQKYFPLDVDERNLMSVGYKNVVGQRRSALLTFNHLYQNAPDDQHISEYIKRVEDELDEKCHEILCDILSNDYIENKCLKIEDKVFYLKMRGDYYRYMAEYKKGEEQDSVAKNSFKAYEDALEASSALEHTDTIKLGLALNFSVFYYEIMREHKKACELAKKSFDDAVANIDKLQEADYKDATLILQLLRDNLSLWMNELGDTDNTEEINGGGEGAEEFNETS